MIIKIYLIFLWVLGILIFFIFPLMLLIYIIKRYPIWAIYILSGITFEILIALLEEKFGAHISAEDFILYLFIIFGILGGYEVLKKFLIYRNLFVINKIMIVLIVFITLLGIYYSSINPASKILTANKVNENTTLYIIIQPNVRFPEEYKQKYPQEYSREASKYKIIDKNLISQLIWSIHKSTRSGRVRLFCPGRIWFHLTNGKVITFEMALDGSFLRVDKAFIGGDIRTSSEFREIYKKIIQNGIGKIEDKDEKR